jgi:hypothetical protein
MIRDQNIEWVRQREFINVTQFNGILETLVSAASTGAIVEMSTLGYMGMPVSANDQIQHVMSFPSYWDIHQPIGVRVVYVALTAASANDSITWEVKYDQADENEALIAPTTALDTLIAADVITSAQTTAAAILKSPRGIIVADKFDESALDGFFGFYVKCTAISTMGNDEANLLGVEWDYYPRWTVGGPNTDPDDRID